MKTVEGKDFTLFTEIREGLVFLHIFFKKFSPSIIKDLRKEVDNLKKRFLGEGHDVVFVTTSDPKIVRFWGLIEPCYKVVNLGHGQWLGSWLTEEI